MMSVSISGLLSSDTDLTELLTVSSRKMTGIPSTIQKAVSIIEPVSKPIALDELAEELCISKFYIQAVQALYRLQSQ